MRIDREAGEKEENLRTLLATWKKQEIDQFLAVTGSVAISRNAPSVHLKTRENHCLSQYESTERRRKK